MVAGFARFQACPPSPADPNQQDKVSTAADMLWTQEPSTDAILLIAHFGNNGLRLARAKNGSAETAVPDDLPRNDVGVPVHEGTLGDICRCSNTVHTSSP